MQTDDQEFPARTGPGGTAPPDRAWFDPTLTMDHVARTRPCFPGDLQHDFRDFQLAQRLPTLSQWVSTAADTYLRAARILGVARTDPIADTLGADLRFDARSLLVAHDHMAAYWRAEHMPAILKGKLRLIGPEGARPLHLSCSCAGLLFAFREWLDLSIDRWATHTPWTLNLFLRAVVGDHTATGQTFEAELWYTLAHIYRVPGVIAPKPLVDPFASDAP